jgi:hypothetical protein
MVSKFKLKNSNVSLFDKETKAYKKEQPYNKEQDSYFNKTAEISRKPKILLSDQEFGKY